VVPTSEAYSAFHARIGDQGLALANGPIAASPIHLILHDLIEMEAFILLYVDNRDALRRLADRLTPFFEAALDALLLCEAEVVWWGPNYDHHVTWPAFFRDEIVPWLQATGDVADDAPPDTNLHASPRWRNASRPLVPSARLDSAA
jgi:hypothetical protein